MIRKLIKYIDLSYWNIGFVEKSVNEILGEDRLSVHWLKHDYQDRWFADPYILDYNKSEITVLVEEFCYALNKGRIAKLTIDRKSYFLKEMKILIEEPTHLSFPVIIRRNSDIYIMPENCATGTLKYYKYDPKTDEVTLGGMVAKLPLTDATVAKMPDGKTYILSTFIPTQNGKLLSIYHLDLAEMKMSEKPVQVIEFNSSIARNAGDVFMEDGVLYRPAQDCNGSYGHGIYLQKLTYYDGRFSIENGKRYFPHDKEYDLGYHTFNRLEDLTVVDAHGHHHLRMSEILNGVRKLKNSLK